MPICRRSRTKACLGLAAAMFAGASALAQESASSANARAAIEAQGDAVMERLKAAIAAQQKAKVQAGTNASTPPKITPPSPANAKARRAFEGLRRRAPSPAMEARARAALATGQAGLAVNRDVMARRVAQALGLEAPERTALDKALAPARPLARVPLLFASSSMPLGELRAYAAQLEPVGGVIAFRGMPGGMARVGPMAKLTAQMLRLDPGCEGPACVMRKVQVIVDPLVFRQHDVRQVPALTLIPGAPTLPYCERDDDSPRGTHLVYGDAALTGLLEEYARLGGKEEARDVQSRLESR